MIFSNKKHILVIEDEAHIAEGLKLNLELKGYEVRIASNGFSGLRLWNSWPPDLIVLDIMLPGIDGLSLLRSIRSEDEQVPILILSAKGDSEDKIKGFSFGVDDYLTKPFNLEEFILRVERLLIRTQRAERGDKQSGTDPMAAEPTYTFGGNCIDFGSRTARGQHGKIRLTGQEVKILKLFFENRGEPVSRQKLLEIGWGYPREMKTRTVDNFIVRFRKYFEKNPRKPVFFKSLRSIGYIFDHDEEDPDDTPE